MLEEVQWPPGKGPATWFTASRLTASHFPQAAGTGGRAPAMGSSQTSPSLPRPCLSRQRRRWAPTGTAVWAGPAPWGTAATALLWTTFSTPVRLVAAAATTRQTQVSPNVQVRGGWLCKWWCLGAGHLWGWAETAEELSHCASWDSILCWGRLVGAFVAGCETQVSLMSLRVRKRLRGGRGGLGFAAVHSRVLTTGQDFQQDGVLRPGEAGGRIHRWPLDADQPSHYGVLLCCSAGHL